MQKIKLFLVVSVFVAGFWSVAAAEMDNPSQEALEKTVKSMKDPNERAKAFQENPKFKEGEAGADLLVKGNQAQKQQLYELAAKVLEGLAKKSDGDPAKMQEIVSKGSQNPSQFMQENLSAEQLKQVRELAAEIEKGREPSPPKPSK